MLNLPVISLEPGVLLAGKYRIERVLGQGGMGVVAAAYHVHLEQRVALKLMLPHAMSNAESVSRFLREARAAARITSDHVARVFDVGTLESGAPYIAMEYLEGSDVSQLLATRGRLGVEEAVEYLLQACEALAEAHAAGIVHRDLKPANLYLAQRVDGQRLVKVLDFGISKMSAGSSQSNAPATRTSALMGSPLYMSPEQMGSSRNVDARSDIWALGVVLHEMLSGLPPFDGETLPQVCHRVMSEPPPPLEQVAPGLPPAVYEVVRRCLQKQPAERFQSVAELAQALESVGSARARQSVERISRVLGVAHTAQAAPVPAAVGATTDPAVAPASKTQANWGETRPPAPRSATPLVLGGLTLLALLAGSAWFALRAPNVGVSTEPAASAPAVLSAPEPAAAPLPPPASPAPAAASSAEPAPSPASPATEASSTVAPPTPASKQRAPRPAAAVAKAKSAPNQPSAATPAAAPAAAAPPNAPATPAPSPPTRSRL